MGVALATDPLFPTGGNRVAMADPTLDSQFLDVVKRLAVTLETEAITWSLTGSTSFVLQGVPFDPNDIDIQTTEEGAYAIEELLDEHVVEPVRYLESERITSHLGAFAVSGVEVEVMGAVQKRRKDGSWESPVDVTEHRRFVDVGEYRVPVLSLAYEAEAYEMRGRTERAALLAEYANR